jgi:RNA polymerase sigma-70 factor (ECF subfamily)
MSDRLQRMAVAARGAFIEPSTKSGDRVSPVPQPAERSTTSLSGGAEGEGTIDTTVEDPATRAALFKSPAGFDTDPAESLETASASDTDDSSAYAVWVDLVERIRTGETDGMAELYHLFSTGIRFYLCRQLGAQELDDKVHDTFVVVVQAIRRGELREPQRLMGFVRTVVRRQVAAHIDKAVHTRREQIELDSTLKLTDPRGNPEEAAMFRQRVQIIRKVLDELPARDKEILTRFYLREQSQEQICAEMSLTETQFRLLKSRAKARFGEIGKKKLASKALRAVFVRTSTGYSH